MIFKNAIVRKPCAEMINGITTSTEGKPDFELAKKQHLVYIEALQACGLSVHVLEADPRFPDSTFVEDVAVCTPHCGIITNPGALSRRGERDAMFAVLAGFYTNVHEITSPGTLDAGDVMMVGSDYYIGLSERTNENGASQLIRILKNYNLNGIKVQMDKMLHLKTGLSYIENNNLLISQQFINDKTFDHINKILINDDEAYSANSLWINGTVLVPKGYPHTLEKIRQARYKTIEVDTSEFRKLDGGLSCLSLRF
jgi:dimethylargininase